jgi:radical SAM superfamily enzyme YgiQ (UPF0313 family)
MYRDKQFSVRSFEDIAQDIEQARVYYEQLGQDPPKIFICDGDALAAPTQLLLQVLELLENKFPNIDRVGIYATAQNILDKSETELTKLYQKRLKILYLGLESGADEVLKLVAKGNTATEMVEAAQKVASIGPKISVIAMLGLGGNERSEVHCRSTAEIVSQMLPDYFSFLTTVAIPGTPYQRAIEKGQITPLSTKELLHEMVEIVSKLNMQKECIFRANHVSNQYPIGGVLPREKKSLLMTLEDWLKACPAGVYPENDPHRL